MKTPVADVFAYLGLCLLLGVVCSFLPVKALLAVIIILTWRKR